MMGKDRAHSPRHKPSVSGPSVFTSRRWRLLRWVLPLALGNLGVVLLFTSPRDGFHCSMVLPAESRAAAAPFSPAANRQLLAWAEAKGLQLSPSLGLGLLPDISYSGAEHAREDLKRRSSSGAEGGRAWGGETTPLRRRQWSRADLNEHGWSLDGALRRPRVRGLLAKRGMAAGDTVCILPLNLALRVKDGQLAQPGNSTVVAATAPQHRLPQDVERLALALLAEKAAGAMSPWASYFAALPLAVPLPLMLPPEELRLVQWGWTQGKVRLMQRELQGSFEHILTSQGAGARPTFEDFRWAVSLVYSRAFRIPFKRPGEEGARKDPELVLMPFMDAINHHFRNHIDWMAKPISTQNTLEMVLKRPLVQGEQVFTSFGPRSNDDLFLYYGFLLDGNPFDSLAIFRSFQDAAKWFVDILETECDNKFLEGSSLADATPLNISARCPRVRWEQVLAAAKAASEAAKPVPGFERETEDWQALLSEWGELGYEYLPYRPGPNIKAGGVVDPTLISVLSSALDLWNGSLPLWRFPVCAGGAVTGKRVISEGNTTQAPGCCRSALGDLVCQGAKDQRKAAAVSYVRRTLVRRCRQILMSLPTSVADDRRMLRDVSLHSADGSGAGCTLGHAKVTGSWLLAVRYRLQKKEMLLQLIHRYSEGW